MTRSPQLSSRCGVHPGTRQVACRENGDGSSPTGSTGQRWPLVSDHLCPVVAGAGGLIDDSWCFESMAEVLVGMPPIVS